MAKRVSRTRRLTTEEEARVRAARAEFAGQPTKAALQASGEYAGPMSLEDYLSWRRARTSASLAQQLQAAIASCGQSLYSIAQGAGVSSPVLQRFMSGERGITLVTAGKLAGYLGLELLPARRE